MVQGDLSPSYLQKSCSFVWWPLFRLPENYRYRKNIDGKMLKIFYSKSNSTVISRREGTLIFSFIKLYDYYVCTSESSFPYQNTGTDVTRPYFRLGPISSISGAYILKMIFFRPLLVCVLFFLSTFSSVGLILLEIVAKNCERILWSVKDIVRDIIYKYCRQWRLVHYVQWFNEPPRNFPGSLIQAYFNNSASNFL